jgi:LPS-assembly lipoprotein
MLLFRSLSIVIIVALLQSCGFTPMYAQREDSADIAEKLATVQIKPIKTLIGQTYVNTLEDILDPAHKGAAKDYVLEATVNKETQALAIEQDRTVTRYKVIVTVNYSLKQISDDKVISSGTVRGQSDYDKVDSDYATYVSEDQTTNRAIRELAQDTKIKIIAALLK